MMVSHGKDARRHRRVVWQALLAAGLAIALSGCDSTLEAVVGPPKGTKATLLPPSVALPPALPQINTSFISDSDLQPGYAGPVILPPTLPADPNEAADQGAEPVAAPGPHRPIASVPLSSDAAALSTLGAAANREKDAADARFVLLVLTPPATDAKSLDSGNTASRQAANEALKALGDAGIASDRVEVSLATSANAGAGEMRLYRR